MGDLILGHFTVSAIFVGVGVCAVVALAPIALADDLPCDQQPPDQQQQCEQNKGAAIANEVVGQVDGPLQQGQQIVKPFIDPQTGKPNAGPRGLRVLINGVDTCLPVGVPAPIGATVGIVPGDMTGACILGP